MKLTKLIARTLRLIICLLMTILTFVVNCIDPSVYTSLLFALFGLGLLVEWDLYLEWYYMNY